MRTGLILKFLALALLLRGQETESKVSLKNNGYRGIVIAINPEVKEDPTLIQAIKSAWTDASRDLYLATRKRAYFKKITILVPTTWTNGTYNPSDDESYKKAAIVVAHQNPANGDVPYTVQYGTCGEPGSYIHLTPDYLLDARFVDDYGPRGKTIVHEWAHYRWGVFDEVVTDGYSPFYLSRSGKVEANRCSLAVKGDNYYVDWNEGTYRDCNIDYQNMLPEDGCVFVPDEQSSSAAEASMMSYQYLDSVYTFCHDDTQDQPNLHNKEAPNEQNRLCNLRSTWDVISSNADFYGDANPSNTELDTKPAFMVVQPKSYERFVLVLDTSGSMVENRLIMMNQAASAFLLQAAPQESEVGMVEFSSSASTLSNMVEIRSNNDRLALTNLLPTEVEGGTSIGSGILEAIEVLEKGGNTAKGGIIIVLSDGEENESPTLSDVYQDTIDSGVIVNSIVFTAAADPMLQVIADDTGGVWYFADENSANSTSALTDAFVTLAKVDDGDSHRETFQIYSKSFVVQNNHDQHTGHIVVDSTIGNNTIFTFTWSQHDTPLGIVLTAPRGCNYATNLTTNNVPPPPACEPGTFPSVDTDLQAVYFAISGTAETGTWIYYVNAQSTFSQNVVVTVTSMAADRDIEPIVVESGMGQVEAAEGQAIVVYAQVSMGYAPVLKADVTALIERPTGNPVTIVLKDRGAAPDVRKNDGIYSKYFTQYNGPGRYSVQVSVTGLEGKTSSAYSSSGSKAAFRVGTTNGGSLTLNPNGAAPVAEQADTGNFSRYTSPGGFSYSGTGSGDVFPPSKVIDLTARQQDVTMQNGGVTISFTAPGDDYDEGTAASYDIRYTYNESLELVNNFDGSPAVASKDIASGCMSNPQEAGTEEAFTFVLSDVPANASEVVVSVAVRAIDDVGNKGEVSNVFAFTYFIEPLQTNIPEETDVEFILMIVFASLFAVSLLVIAGLAWKIASFQKGVKPSSGSETHHNPYSTAKDC